MYFSTATLMAVAATLPGALAHYNFEALIINGNVTGAYEFVRSTTNSNSPITDLTSTDMICNQGGISDTVRAKTGTASVNPGDELGFTVNSEIGHPGPLSLWMSKAPDGTSAQEYTGDGDWFKVYELTTSSITSEGLQWATTTGSGGAKNFTFSVPTDLPAGDYLLRAEHIALHGAQAVGGAQFYIGCAQLTVGGSGSGSPSPTTKIPGMYTGTEPGIQINIYYPVPTSYTPAGIETWPGKCVDHTINLDGQSSDGDCNGDSGSGAGGNSTATATATATATGSSATSAVASKTASGIFFGTASGTAPGTAPGTASGTIAATATPKAVSTTSAATASSKASSTLASASATATPKTSCSRRRRARRAAKHI